MNQCQSCGIYCHAPHTCVASMCCAGAGVEVPVIVTTIQRGVFFGYAKDTTGETITLKRARLCVFWSNDMRGFMGLASHGPSAGCRIGHAADITLRNISAVLSMTPEAVAKWESAPWWT